MSQMKPSNKCIDIELNLEYFLIFLVIFPTEKSKLANNREISSYS